MNIFMLLIKQLFIQNNAQLNTNISPYTYYDIRRMMILRILS